MTSVSPSQSPGISTRSVPGGTSRNRAIHGVVMSAATVIFMTATSAWKSGVNSASTRLSAGSASLPVTNSTRRDGTTLSRRGAVPPLFRPAVATYRGSPDLTHLLGVPSSAPPSGRQRITSSIFRASSKSLSVMPPAA